MSIQPSQLLNKQLNKFNLTTPLYRVAAADSPILQVKTPQSTLRPPSYVSYLVDNLWEWKRPNDYPNRRLAVFANPDVSAIKINDGKAFEIELFGLCKIAQTSCEDARDHKDIKALPKLLMACLGRNWPSLTLAQKMPIGALYMPCLSKEEVEDIFNSALNSHKQKIEDAITFWDSVSLIAPNSALPHTKGEVFFEAQQWWLK